MIASPVRLCLLLLLLLHCGLGELRRSAAVSTQAAHSHVGTQAAHSHVGIQAAHSHEWFGRSVHATEAKSRASMPPQMYSPSKSYESYIKQFGKSEDGNYMSATAKTYCINDTDIAYNYKGNVSIYETFATCLRNTPDALLAPYYDDGETIDVECYNILNNFISVNELENIVNFDMFLVLTWRDPRLSMPGLWSNLNSRVQELGVDITQAFYEQNINQDSLRFWVPDIFFPEVSALSVNSESLSAFPDGVFVWTRHMIIEFLNSDLEYKSYPDDEQTISLRYLSFALPSNELRLFLPTDLPPVAFFKNVAGEQAFSTNSIWEFVDATAYTENPSVAVENEGVRYDFEYRSFSVLEFRIRRNSTGIVTRLAFPIFLLIFLAGLIFWAKFDDRLDFTVTILLAVSSLYIVIFQTIPMIGYLTTLDKYITQMFTTLFVCAGVHQFILRLKQNDSDVTWPLRKFYIRSLEAIGRVVVIPFIFVRYFTSFTQFYELHTLVCSYIILYLLSSFTHSLLLLDRLQCLRLLVHVGHRVDGGKAGNCFFYVGY